MRGTITDPYRPPVKPPTPVPSFNSARWISYIPIGETSNDASTRMIGGAVDGNKFWDNLYSGAVEPAAKAGVTRFLFHNPGGTLPNQNMQWTQWTQAKNAGLTWLTDNFAKFIARMKSDWPNAEPIVYLGNQAGDLLLDAALADPDKGAGMWKYIRAAIDAIKPFLDAGVNSFAFDGSGGYLPDSTAFYLIDLMRSCGKKIYVEARPALANGVEPPQKAWPSITQDNFFRAQGTNPAWAVPLAHLTGEVIRLIDQPLPGKSWTDTSWIVPTCKQIIKDGHTVCFGADFMLLHGLSLADATNP